MPQWLHLHERAVNCILIRWRVLESLPVDVRTQTPDRMVQPRRTVEEMFPLVEQYNERPRSAAAFCAEHGVSYGPLNY